MSTRLIKIEAAQVYKVGPDHHAKERMLGADRRLHRIRISEVGIDDADVARRQHREIRRATGRSERSASRGDPGASDKLRGAVGAFELHSIDVAEQMLLRVEPDAAADHRAPGIASQATPRRG